MSTSGGELSNAAYRNCGTHAEVTEIVFSAYQMTYRDLLGFLLRIHDPTTLNRLETCAGS
jgi:peptide methionine sulfoxide reductase MsrA